MSKLTLVTKKQKEGILPLINAGTSTHAGRTIFPFVDLIRFVSMMGIVFAHTDALPDGIEPFTFFKNSDDIGAYIVFKQTFKFSVVCFFMISGFLLGDKIRNVSATVYFKRRVRSTLRPFLIAFTIFIILLLIRDYLNSTNTIDLLNPKSIYYIIFYTPYWYLPTYFIGLFTILLFSKYIKSVWLGAALLVVTVLYTFPGLYNSSFGSHSTSVFAFVFYMWLGVYIRFKNYAQKIKLIPFSALLIAICLTFVLASYQSYNLLQENNQYFFNNLRIFNQLYGISVFLFLVRISPPEPNFYGLNPRKETYGIYLYHFPVIIFLFPVFTSLTEAISGQNFYSYNIYLTLLYSFIKFLVCYIVTILIVKALVKLKIQVL